VSQFISKSWVQVTPYNPP